MRHNLAALALVLLPGVARAQTVSLRYHPGPGVRVATISEVRTSAVMFGLPSLPDSSVVESDWRTVHAPPSLPTR